MLPKMLQKLTDVSKSRWYWLTYIVLSVGLLSGALFYQFYLEELPCVLCIHVRLWITLLLIVSCIGLLTGKYKKINLIAHISTLAVAIALLERSYQLLGTERGFVFGDCGFSLGMPAWFAVDQWLPWLYRVETSCGYTPEIIFGITMAEALMAMSICLLLLSASIFMAFTLTLMKGDR